MNITRMNRGPFLDYGIPNGMVNLLFDGGDGDYRI